MDRIPFPQRTINYIALRKIRDHIQAHQRPVDVPRVLDVGCGAGFLLRHMLRDGWDALGVDPYPRGAALRPPLKERVIAGSLEDVPEGGFHAVTAIEVLEHVEEYPSLLREMLHLLEPGGLLVVTVPNDWEFRAVEGPGGTLEPMYGHLWRFGREDLEADLASISDSVEVESVYSRHLDRRIYLFSRLFHPSSVVRLSQILVDHHDDGAGSFQSGQCAAFRGGDLQRRRRRR